tara:strand:+ start:747 stop:2075 length:1329 start_codon:yes stop_codon:yes gene_type:complete
MVAFYNQADQELYKKYQYLPQEQYRLGLNLPKDPVTSPVSEGITNTNAFTNSGGGGALQTGDPMMNYGNYFDYTRDKFMDSQKTPNVDMNYNQKLQSNFMGMPSYRQQELTGPDLGEYIGGQEIGYTPGGELGFSYGTEVPLEQTTAGKIQSGLQSTGRGIKNLMGMLPTPSNFLNKFGIQNFNSLSPADQAFIKMNSGYRGPTIFGENTAGTSKDPFGRNVESLFGNYAEKVRSDFDKLSTNLSADGVIGSKDAYKGATFDPVSGTFKADDEADEKSIAAAAYANKMNKINLSRYRFDKKAIEQQGYNQKNIEKAAGVRDTKAAQDFMRNNPNYGDAEKNKNTGSGGGKGYDSQADYSGSDKRSEDNRSSDLGFSDIRLKENVELIGKSPSNINIYKFNYKDSPTTYQGAMAHEVPWASIKHSNGYMMVDYNQIDVNFKKI